MALLTVPAAAQCTVSGEVRVARAALPPAELPNVLLPRVDVPWPSAEPVAARLRAPFDAPVELTGVPLHIAPAAELPEAFFEQAVGHARTGSIAVSMDGHAVTIGALVVRGVRVRCADVRLGAPSDPPHRRDGVTGYELDEPVRFFAAPSARARSVEVAALSPTTVELVERRGDWARLRYELSSGTALVGWVRHVERAYSSGAGGFHGRIVSVPTPIPRPEGCYVGPSFFGERAPIFADEHAAEPWGAITDGHTMLVRDCGGARAEIIAALGVRVSFGWVDGASLTRLGAVRCDGFVLHQDRRSLRMRVLEATLSALHASDEIARFGTVRLIPRPLDMGPVGEGWLSAEPHFPSEVCDAWRRGEPLRVRRDGEEVVLGR